jgi:hypothetical protein
MCFSTDPNALRPRARMRISRLYTPTHQNRVNANAIHSNSESLMVFLHKLGRRLETSVE